MRNKKTVITVTSIVAVLLVIIGVTYAYWLVTKTQTNQNVISSGCLDISLTGEKNDIELTEQFPLSDEDGMKLTPYEFTVTNNCTTSVDYQVNLESIGDSTNAIKAGAIKVALDNNIRLLATGGTEETTISGAYESNKLVSGTLPGSSEETEEDAVTYELRIWIDANAPISEQNKTFQSKISVTVGQGVFNPYKNGTLAYSILSNYGGADSIEKITDFSTVTTSSDAGLYKAQDDLGTSYYFRGAPTNNYVKFGTEETEVEITPYQIEYWYTYDEDGNTTVMDGIVNAETEEECLNSTLYANLVEQYKDDTNFSISCIQYDGYGTITTTKGMPIYWRIVRINGDGTVRMIYDGNIPVANGVSHTASIGEYQLMYMEYSNTNPDGVKEGLDTWYEDNLESAYGKFIADSIFCNDNEIVGYSEPYEGVGGETYTDPIYASYARLSQSKNPKLTCTNKNDRYTVSDVKGNGLLSNPIALLTADEAVMSGLTLQANNSHYLSNANDAVNMLLTPCQYWSDSFWGTVYGISNTGALTQVYGYGYARPVINLKADVKFIGDGSYETPYEIVMD